MNFRKGYDERGHFGRWDWSPGPRKKPLISINPKPIVVLSIKLSNRRKTDWHRIDVYSAGGVNEIVIALGSESCDHGGERLTSR